MSRGVDVLAVIQEHVAHYDGLQRQARDEGNYHYADELEEDSGTLNQLRLARAAVAELIDAATEIRASLNIIRSNVMTEIKRGAKQWDGVPDLLQQRIDTFDSALASVRGYA